MIRLAKERREECYKRYSIACVPPRTKRRHAPPANRPRVNSPPVHLLYRDPPTPIKWDADLVSSPVDTVPTHPYRRMQVCRHGAARRYRRVDIRAILFRALLRHATRESFGNKTSCEFFLIAGATGTANTLLHAVD